MVLVTNSKRMWLAGMAVSLLIFAVLYLTVIQPSTNTANQLVRQGQQALSTGIKQSQQAIKQDQQQVKAAGGNSSAVSTAVNKAAKLSSCVAAAATDPSKIQACEVKYGG